VDVHLVTEGLRDLLERSLGSKARLRTAVPESLPPVLVDVEQFEVALMNLAVNAGHAMSAGGAFTVSAQLHRLPLPEADPADGAPALREPLGLSPGPYLRVLAEDEGVGMDAETLARAAEPFFTTKPVGQGSGFGLAMVQGFAEQSGGRLVIESEPGRGTRVAIWLPAADGGTR
jgi:signal transduction histidine kinase